MAAGDEADEDEEEGTGSAATAARVVEYESADSCGWSSRTAGNRNFRACLTKLGPEREA